MDEGKKYLPFFRKYRPQSFGEIVGQKHLIKALSTAIELNRIANAYLFCGPRGTGKTSTARIFAKSLNCSKGISIEPCQKCPSCVDITNASGLDVIEIDAASSRGINEAKELISQVHYAPINGKFKIFIIDEVHMLTTEAFNTLLKTFEEPPQNVIFILATTEPHKVLETIVSRCQRYDFRRITVDDIVEKLEEVAKIEKINITKDAIYAIAKYSNGGLRDSLALLDQVSVLGLSSQIVEADIDSLVGKISFKPMFDLLLRILSKDIPNAIKSLEEMLENGSEPRNLVENFIDFLKNVSIILSSTEVEFARKITLFPVDDIELIKNSNFKQSDISLILSRVITFYRDIKSATNPYLWAELMIVELASEVCAEPTIVSNIQSAPIKVNTPAVKTREKIAQVVKEIEEVIVPQEIKKVDEVQEVVEQLEQVKPEVIEETKVEEVKVEQTTVEEVKVEQTTVGEVKVEQTTVSPALVAQDITDVNYIWAEIVSGINGKFAQAFFKGVPLSVDLKDNVLTVGFLNQNVIAQANAKLSVLKEAVSNVLNPEVSIVFMQNPTGQKTISEPKIIEKKQPVFKDVPIAEENYLKEPVSNTQEKAENKEEKADNFYSEKTKMYLDAFNGKVVD